MYAWPAPELPVLPGQGAPLRVYDSAAGDLVTTVPGPVARLYVCGITPYDATHMGHAATYVAFDLLQRAWRDAGHRVHYVQNVTDVDDPLLERAARDGEDWAELAERETTLFREDMTALRVLPPDHYIGVVEAIDRIVPLVVDLREKGAAYDVDGDIYFSVASDPRFGAVSGLSSDDMLKLSAERGGDPERPGKKNPLDPLLWRAARVGEPSWPGGGLGRGRPGWHIECSTIALRYLGSGFDIQGGGTDLVFPHHEMSAAQAVALTGRKEFARAYVHQAMVAYEGEKMSKSKGNLVLVSRLREDDVDPMAIRLVLLAHHYRRPWEYHPGLLREAEERLARWRAAACRPPSGAGEVVTEIRRALADDLDAPAALAAVDAWAAASPGPAEPGAPARQDDPVVAAVQALLGVRLLARP